MKGVFLRSLLFVLLVQTHADSVRLCSCSEPGILIANSYYNGNNGNNYYYYHNNNNKNNNNNNNNNNYNHNYNHNYDNYNNDNDNNNNNNNNNGGLKGCDPNIHLRRLQVGHITSPGKVHFKYKLQVDRLLRRPNIEFTITKLMIPLPCMGGFGSCTYSLCGYEQYSIEKKICAGWGCQCPVKAGVYYSGLVSINMPDLRPLGAAAYGPVRVQIRFREGSRIIHCTAFRINVHRPENSAEQNRADVDFELPRNNMTDISISGHSALSDAALKYYI